MGYNNGDIHTLEENSIIYLGGNPVQNGGGLYQAISTQVGKKYIVKAILIGANHYLPHELHDFTLGSSYVSVDTDKPTPDSQPLAITESVIGNTPTTVDATFTASATITYISLRGDSAFRYPKASYISVKELRTDEETPRTDNIKSISGSETITRGEEVTLTVDYVASQARTLTVYLKTTTGIKKNYFYQRIEVNASDEIKEITFTVPENAPTDETYKYGVYIAPVGEYYSSHLAKAYQYGVKVDDNGTSSNPDTTPPVLTLLGDNPVNLIVGASYTDLGATATDNVDGDVTANIMTVNPVDTTTAGTYTVTYDVNDTAGNDAESVIRTVVVNKPANQLPTVGISMEGSTPEAVPQYTVTVFTAFGLDVDGVIVSYAWEDNGESIGEGEYFEHTFENLGEHNISMTVTDDIGATATDSMLITVVDVEAPVITLLGANPQQLTVGDAYTELGATAVDIAGNLSYTDGIIIDISGIDTSVEGNYTVTYNVEDDAGNAAPEVNRTVVVTALVNLPITREELIQLIQDWAKKPSIELMKKIEDANTSHITDMSGIFSLYSLFCSRGVHNYDRYDDVEYFNIKDISPDISRWDVSNVTDMRGMFCGARTFYSDISNWDVSNVTSMSYMFANRTLGINNVDLSRWDVSNVTSMYRMFLQSNFSQDISDWNVSNVVNSIDFSLYSDLPPEYLPNFP